MLVPYTSVYSLPPAELAALKRHVQSMRFEGSQMSYQFQGKTFSMMEINSLRQPAPQSTILLG